MRRAVPAAYEPITRFQVQRSDSVWRDGAPAGDGPIGLAERIDAFRASGVSPRTWQAIEPTVKRWVRETGASSVNDLGHKLTVASRLLEWAHESGLDCDASYLLHPETVEAFLEDALVGSRGGTKPTYRSHLRAIGEAVVGSDAVPLRQVLRSKSEPERPYSASERTGLYWAIKGLRTHYQRVNAETAFELGVGAGMGTSDLSGACGTDFSWTAGALVCDITWGPRPRRVVVKAKYEQDVWARAEQVGERPMFRPERTQVRKNDIGMLLDRLEFSGLPRLSIQRLRVTWIVDQLTAGVPAHVVASAAGVKEGQIGRYYRFVPDLDEETTVALLRGAT